MNELLFTRNLWLEYIFTGLPATIVIIKMILEDMFSKLSKRRNYAASKFRTSLEKKYDCFNFYHFYSEVARKMPHL